MVKTNDRILTVASFLLTTGVSLWTALFNELLGDCESPSSDILLNSSDTSRRTSAAGRLGMREKPCNCLRYNTFIYTRMLRVIWNALGSVNITNRHFIL